jgi:polysaccharide biosynthesis transport protein
MKDFAHLEPGDYLRIPWKRKGYFFAVAILVIVGGTIYAWLRPVLYRSETRVIVESATILDDPLVPTAAQQRTDERINAIRQLIESRSILEKIIEEFRLRAYDSSITMEDALKNISNNLEVDKAAGGGSTFTMAYYATDPQAAQAITRRLAEVLIQANQISQKNRAIDKDQFLEQELSQAQLDLAAVDEKIRQFKTAHLGELPEQSEANINALNSLQTQLVALNSALDRDNDQQKVLDFRLQEQIKISAISKRLEAAKQGLDLQETKETNTISPLSTQVAAKRAQLAEMTARYTARHPDVIRLSKEVQDLEKRLAAQTTEQAKASAGLTPLDSAGNSQAAEATSGLTPSQAELSGEADIAQIRYELATLKGTIARREKERETILSNISTYQSRLNLAPALEQELQALVRERETRQEQAVNLQNRKFNAQMAANAMANTKYETYRILDEANLPERQVPPTRLQIILVSLGAALVTGIGATLAREYFEPSLASEEEAAAVLKMPILVSISEIPSRSKASLNN